ncbi:UNVERIFIED_CONTAM: hypothetical protein FKN15_070954 [Acipenser sinensis]
MQAVSVMVQKDVTETQVVVSFHQMALCGPARPVPLQTATQQETLARVTAAQRETRQIQNEQLQEARLETTGSQFHPSFNHQIKYCFSERGRMTSETVCPGSFNAGSVTSCRSPHPPL